MSPGTATGDGALFPRLLLEALSRRGDRVAFEQGTAGGGVRVVRCGELLDLVARLVRGLRSAGLGPGRGVAVVAGPGPEAFAAVVAVHALGCRLVPIRPGWSAGHLAAVLGDGVDAVVGDPPTLTPELLAHAGRAAVLSLGEHPGHLGATDLLAGAAGDGDGVGAAGAASIAVEARPGDIARLNFTSGSTGRPKGCARTYRTFSLDHQPERWPLDLARLVAAMERFLLHQPLAVPAPFTFAARSLLVGGTVVVPGADDLDAQGKPRLADTIARHRITGLLMPVPSLQRLVAGLRDCDPGSGSPADLGSLRALVVTGSPASPGLLAEAMARLGPVVWQGYGQAESGMISLLTPDEIADHGDEALASVGRLVPDVEISVRDAGGRPVAPGAVGEIHVRSPRVMDRYWGDPQQTREVLDGGWLRTRDLGRLDPRGLLHLTGRSRDVVIVNAEVCYAGAIERVLARHPGVEQAYVVGVPDGRTGEAVHAFVVARQHDRAAGPAGPLDAGPDPDELRALVRAELTPNHVPATIRRLRAVPVAASGKPDKHLLTALALGQPPSARHLPDH